MIEEKPSEQGKQASEQPPAVTPAPVQPSSVDDTRGKLASENRPDEPKKPRKLLVEVLRNGAHSEFEKQNVDLAQKTFDLNVRQAWLTICAILIAALGAAFVAIQIQEMTYNNQILASQSESAAAGGLFSDMNTRRQLDIATRQAQAAQDNVATIQQQMKMDERPWLEFEEGDGKITFTVDEAISLPVRFTNIGRTPALKIEGLACVEIVPVGHDPDFAKWDSGISMKMRKDESFPKRYETKLAGAPCNWIKTTIIYPRGKRELSFGRVRLNDTGKAEDDPLRLHEFNSLTHSTAYFSIYGQIWYWDVFGVRHWTKFCGSKTFNGSPSQSSKCVDYSDVDHNQPN